MLLCVYRISLLLYFISFILFVTCFRVNYIGGGVLLLVEVLNVSCVRVRLPLLLDEIRCSFGMLVCFVSASVVLYSAGYMKGERFLNRFI